MNEVIFKVEHLKKWFTEGSFLTSHSVSVIKAVDDISLQIYKGEILGIVGESGCGKSTLIRTMLRLTEPTSGKIFFEGKDITHISAARLKLLRKDIQIVFQDPYAALDPRQRVREMLKEPLFIHHLVSSDDEAEKAAEKLLEMVGIPKDGLTKFPHEFSGGQRQRLCIARALAVRPKILMCDECVSALDVSIQAQIINLLMQLQRDMDLTMVFVSHDLRVVHHMANHVAVMYLGHVVEYGEGESVFEHPKNAYTKTLLSAVPIADPAKRKRKISVFM